MKVAGSSLIVIVLWRYSKHEKESGLFQMKGELNKFNYRHSWVLIYAAGIQSPMQLGKLTGTGIIRTGLKYIKMLRKLSEFKIKVTQFQSEDLPHDSHMFYRNMYMGNCSWCMGKCGPLLIVLEIALHVCSISVHKMISPPPPFSSFYRLSLLAFPHSELACDTVSLGRAPWTREWPITRPFPMQDKQIWKIM